MIFRDPRTVVDVTSISEYVSKVPRTPVVTAAESNRDVVW